MQTQSAYVSLLVWVKYELYTFFIDVIEEAHHVIYSNAKCYKGQVYYEQKGSKQCRAAAF